MEERTLLGERRGTANRWSPVCLASKEVVVSVVNTQEYTQVASQALSCGRGTPGSQNTPTYYVRYETAEHSRSKEPSFLPSPETRLMNRIQLRQNDTACAITPQRTQMTSPAWFSTNTGGEYLLFSLLLPQKCSCLHSIDSGMYILGSFWP